MKKEHKLIYIKQRIVPFLRRHYTEDFSGSTVAMKETAYMAIPELFKEYRKITKGGIR